MQTRSKWIGLCLAVSFFGLSFGAQEAKADFDNKKIARNLDTIGKRWEERRKAGTAVLIFATPKRGFAKQFGRYDYRGHNMSSEAEWYGEQGVAASKLYLEMFDNPYADEIYQVILLPAGTYHLNNFNATLPGAEFKDELAKSQPTPKKVGTVELSHGSFTDMGSHTIWMEPQYNVVRSDRYVCNYVIAGSSTCVSGGYVNEKHKVLVREGRYADVAHVTLNDALMARVSLRQPFASITLGPGEVILTDSIVARVPNYSYGANACLASSEDTVRCELSSFGAEVFPAKIDDFREGGSAGFRIVEKAIGTLMTAEKLPYDASKRLGADHHFMSMLADTYISRSMWSVLSKAQYRPLSINAPAAPHNQPTYSDGKVYVISADQS